MIELATETQVRFREQMVNDRLGYEEGEVEPSPGKNMGKKPTAYGRVNKRRGEKKMDSAAIREFQARRRVEDTFSIASHSSFGHEFETGSRGPCIHCGWSGKRRPGQREPECILSRRKKGKR